MGENEKQNQQKNDTKFVVNLSAEVKEKLEQLRETPMGKVPMSQVVKKALEKFIEGQQ